MFRYKYNSVKTIKKRKARLVTCGFTQKQGIDYNETYSPTLKHEPLRIVTALAVKYNFKIFQIDIKAAYLYTDLDEIVYMEIPEGARDYQKGYWKFVKSLYELKQSGRLWNEKLNSKLTHIGFKRFKREPCMYVKINKRS